MEGFEGFESLKGLSDLIEGFSAVAEMAKAAYNSFVQVGFTPHQAMDLTKQQLTMILGPIFEKAMKDAIPNG